MGAALRNDYALDGSAAIKARLTRPAVDRQVLTVAARLAFSVAIDGVEGGAPVFNRRAQYAARCVEKEDNLLVIERIGRTAGMELAGEEHFIHVDVAQTRNEVLIEQKRLQCGCAACKAFPQDVSRKRRIKGSGPSGAKSSARRASSTSQMRPKRRTSKKQSTRPDSRFHCARR